MPLNIVNSHVNYKSFTREYASIVTYHNKCTRILLRTIRLSNPKHIST